MFKRFKKIFLYLSLLFLGSIAGVYLFFPSELARKYINLNQDKVIVGKIDLLFPIGFHFSDVKIHVSEEEEDIKFSEISLYPSLILPITLPFGKSKIKIIAKTSKTNIQIQTYLAKDQDKIIMRAIQIGGEIEASDFPINPKIKGKGKVKIDTELDNINNFENLSGKIKLFSNRLTLEVSGFDFFEGEITLGETELVANVSSGKINIIRLESKGGDIEGMITGSIKAKKELSDSEIDLILDLKTKIINLPAQKFKLQGNIFQPKISSL